MSKLFLYIYDFLQPRQKIFYFLLLLSLAVLLFLAAKVRLQEDVIRMLPADKEHGKLNDFYKNSKISDRILFRLSSANSGTTVSADSLIPVCEKLVEQLQQEAGEFIESVEYKVDDSEMAAVLTVIDQNLPYFLEEEDYKLLDSITSGPAIEAKIGSNYKTLSGPAGIAMSRFIVRDPLGLNIIAYQKLQNLKSNDQISLYENHFFSQDNKFLLFFINPAFPSSETVRNGIFGEKIRHVTDSISEAAGVKIDFFGAPLVAAGNAAQIRKDVILTTSLTILILVIIVAWFFRRLYYSLLLIIPVIFGALFALTAIYFIRGEVSVIAIGAGSLVLGIAVNYSLHFLMHHRYHGRVRDAVAELSYPMTVGSLTTIAGFMCLQFVKAPVLQDLGLFSALCLTGAAVSSLVFLPHLIRNKAPETGAGSALANQLDNFLDRLQGRKKLALAFLILSPLFFWFAKDVQFEDDMTKINYMSDELKRNEEEINRTASFYHKSVFIFSQGATLDQALSASEAALDKLKEMKREGILNSYSGVSSFYISEKEQAKRLSLWHSFWTEERKLRVLNDLQKAGEHYGFTPNAFISFTSLLDREFDPLLECGLGNFGHSMAGNFIDKNQTGYYVISLLKPAAGRVQDVYSSLSDFSGITVFDRQFIVDKLVDVVNDDFSFIAIVTSLLVLISLLIAYGRIELALISFIPMVIAWIWILGIMSLLGIKFNIINVILSTLVFALGDDYCIFTMDGLKEEYAKRKRVLRSVRASILFSVLTTIAGLGVLILAKHPALRSIALVSIVGLLSVWFISQTLQPYLFRIFIQAPASRKQPPYTLWGLIKSVFAFGYFLFGALLLTVIGFVLIKLIPFQRERMKLAYHFVISKFKGSLIYIMANVKKRIINTTGENFSKPAIIISNHQSFLDILALGMLNPKLIFLTNKWVWNSPVFGFVVRMADYYPVAEGAENSIARLAERVRMGYSVVIFPEGTRSASGLIRRFHKGAFYLAEQLQLDILPIVLHGTGYCMTKGEFLLKDSQITLKFLPRISITDTRFGTSYSERAKLTGRYFREQYEILKKETEQPEFFLTHIHSNFIYKGPVLEWYMKIKMRLEDSYRVFHGLVPSAGKILDLGCGYGFMSYMLGYLSGERNITAIDYDEEKIEIAVNGYARPDNVQFIHQDVRDFPGSGYDAIILSDVLHYLQPNDQLSLLDRCARNLSPGGVMVLREGLSDLQGRHRGTRLSEWFSTRIFTFNKTGEKKLAFISSTVLEDFARRHGFEMDRIDNSKLTSNVIFSFKKS